jgi:hypothetical protein
VKLIFFANYRKLPSSTSLILGILSIYLLVSYILPSAYILISYPFITSFFPVSESSIVIGALASFLFFFLLVVIVLLLPSRSFMPLHLSSFVFKYLLSKPALTIGTLFNLALSSILVYSLIHLSPYLRSTEITSSQDVFLLRLAYLVPTYYIPICTFLSLLSSLSPASSLFSSSTPRLTLFSLYCYTSFAVLAFSTSGSTSFISLMILVLIYISSYVSKLVYYFSRLKIPLQISFFFNLILLLLLLGAFSGLLLLYLLGKGFDNSSISSSLNEIVVRNSTHFLSLSTWLTTPHYSYNLSTLIYSSLSKAFSNLTGSVGTVYLSPARVNYYQVFHFSHTVLPRAGTSCGILGCFSLFSQGPMLFIYYVSSLSFCLYLFKLSADSILQTCWLYMTTLNSKYDTTKALICAYLSLLLFFMSFYDMPSYVLDPFELTFARLFMFVVLFRSLPLSYTKFRSSSEIA